MKLGRALNLRETHENTFVMRRSTPTGAPPGTSLPTFQGWLCLCGVTTAAEIVNAFPAGSADDAAALVFEYMAATQVEIGQPRPADIGELPPVLQRECQSLQWVYRPPGALLIAYCDSRPVGCVGLAASEPEDTAEIKRLYVRAAHRRKGIARALMGHAHDHAARRGITRLILDVLPTRTNVIDFYRRLGYTDAEPYATSPSVPMIYMQRSMAGASAATSGQ